MRQLISKSVKLFLFIIVFQLTAANVQKKNGEYIQLIPDDAPPPIFLNKEIQSEFREELEKFYYDETKYDTYLEQLGVKYPTMR